MSSYDLTVVNMALATLQKAPADSLENPTSSYERWAVLLFDEAREAALVAWWFPEVRARKLLEASAREADALEFGQGKRYRVPEDCLKVHRVGKTQTGGWTREGDFIITEATAAIQVHYYRNIPSEDCGPLLRRLIAAQLAVDIARAVSDSGAAMDRAQRSYDRAWAAAAGAAGEQAGFENQRDIGSEEMARAGVGYGRFSAVDRSRG